jgi:hypothetical protein
MKTLGTLVVLGSVLLASPCAFADLVVPAVEACDGLSAGTPCDGGICENSTCSKGWGGTGYDCLICVAAGGSSSAGGSGAGGVSGGGVAGSAGLAGEGGLAGPVATPRAGAAGMAGAFDLVSSGGSAGLSESGPTAPKPDGGRPATGGAPAVSEGGASADGGATQATGDTKPTSNASAGTSATGGTRAARRKSSSGCEFSALGNTGKLGAWLALGGGCVLLARRRRGSDARPSH